MELEKLLHEYETGLAATSYVSWREKAIIYINDLINNNFDALLQLLYRVDVSEKKIRNLLAGNEDRDAATIIFDLIKERLDQKIESRKKFKSNNNEIDPEEKW